MFDRSEILYHIKQVSKKLFSAWNMTTSSVLFSELSDTRKTRKLKSRFEVKDKGVLTLMAVGVMGC